MNRIPTVFVTTFLLALFVMNATGQGEGLNREVVLRSHGATMFYKPPSEDIIGSPYLFDVWFSGYVLLSGDTTHYDAAFLYDAASDIMLFTDGEDTMSVTKPLKVELISFADMDFVYALSIERSGGQDFIRGGYFQLMSGDSLRLLRKNRKSVDENTSVSNYMGGGGDGRRRYILSHSLYVQVKGEDVVKLKRRKSWILNLMRDHEEEIRGYIKEHKISLQSTVDIVELFDYYGKISTGG